MVPTVWPGRRVSLVFAVSEFCEAAKRLHGRTMIEAVAGFMRDAATVKSKLIGEAVEQFIESRQHKNDSKPANGRNCRPAARGIACHNGWRGGNT